MATSTAEKARLATLTTAEYAAEENARMRAWAAEAPEGESRFFGLLEETPGAYPEYANGLEMAFGFAVADFSDAYKSVHGIRPRWMRFSDLNEVEAAMEALCEEEHLYIVPEWDGVDPRTEAEHAAAAAEAVRAHEERYMDTAAAWGACGW